MTYQLTIRPKAVKELERINEPYYSNIKTAIYSLAENPRPQGSKKLKGVTVIVFVWVITALSTTSLMQSLQLT